MATSALLKMVAHILLFGLISMGGFALFFIYRRTHQIPLDRVRKLSGRPAAFAAGVALLIGLLFGVLSLVLLPSVMSDVFGK